MSKILPPYIPQWDFPSERAKIAKCSRGYSCIIFVVYRPVIFTFSPKAQGTMSEGLASLFGTGVASSSATISRLTKVSKDEYAAFKNQRFEGKQFVYIWADGIYFRVRLERLCTLVLMGAREDGSKELIAVEDGFEKAVKAGQTFYAT